MAIAKPLLVREGMIGAVEVALVQDTIFMGLTAQNWLPKFDREAVREHECWLSPHHYDPENGRIPLPVHSFVLRTAHHTILIDTCVGNHKSRPGSAEMHMLTTRYLDRLAALGLCPQDVDFVMCTHLHTDHIGWNTQLVNGRWLPTFPNARYVMSSIELAAVRDEVARPETTTPNRNRYEDSILPVIEAGQVIEIDGVYEILDLLTFRPAPGHTAGNMRIELRSCGETAIFAGDILHSPIQIPFWRWSSRVCSDPALAGESRRQLLEDCVAENALLLPGHFVAPHVGRIHEQAGSFMINFGW